MVDTDNIGQSMFCAKAISLVHKVERITNLSCINTCGSLKDSQTSKNRVIPVNDHTRCGVLRGCQRREGMSEIRSKVTVHEFNTILCLAFLQKAHKAKSNGSLA